MTSRQRQDASAGSVAIQASGDVNYTHGFSATQMIEVFGSLQRLVEVYTEQSRELIEKRLDSFREGLIEEFSGMGKGQPEAFSDPDFQGALLDAQKSVARSGDETLKDLLIDLVSQKSRCSKRDRVSLTLNDAIAKVGSIPGSDLNSLTLMFILQNVQHNGLANIKGLSNFLEMTMSSLVQNISLSDSAANYLAAHGCLIPPSGIATQSNFLDILLRRYGNLLTKGASEADFRSTFSDFEVLVTKGMIVRSPFDNDLLVFAAAGPNLKSILPQIGLIGDYAEKYEAMTKASRPSEDEFKAVMSRDIPEIDRIMSAYNQSFIRNSRLTSVGIALAHANLTKSVFHDVDLSIWIQE